MFRPEFISGGKFSLEKWGQWGKSKLQNLSVVRGNTIQDKPHPESLGISPPGEEALRKEVQKHLKNSRKKWNKIWWKGYSLLYLEKECCQDKFLPSWPISPSLASEGVLEKATTFLWSSYSHLAQIWGLPSTLADLCLRGCHLSNTLEVLQVALCFAFQQGLHRMPQFDLAPELNALNCECPFMCFIPMRKPGLGLPGDFQDS